MLRSISPGTSECSISLNKILKRVAPTGRVSSYSRDAASSFVNNTAAYLGFLLLGVPGNNPETIREQLYLGDATDNAIELISRLIGAFRGSSVMQDEYSASDLYLDRDIEATCLDNLLR